MAGVARRVIRLVNEFEIKKGGRLLYAAPFLNLKLVNEFYYPPGYSRQSGITSQEAML